MPRKQALEAQADIIEKVLAQHKIKAQVTGGALLPRHVRFDVSTLLGEKIKGIRGLLDEIALALGAKEARLDRSAHGLAIQVPRSDPQTVSLTRIIEGLKNPGPVRPVLGLGDNKVPILANLLSPDVAHVLIAGTTGSGKSSLVRTMIISMAMWSTTAELAMVLIDPKGSEFNDLASLPHLAMDIITDPKQAAQALDMLATTMDSGNDRAETTVVIVIDEVADLLMTAGRKATHALTRLTQRGRSAGLHIIAATQKPTAEALGSLIKANFPLRLVGRVTSPEEAKTASGYAGTGAERLQGAGAFIAVSSERHYFTAAHASRTQVAALIRQIQVVAGPARERLIIPVDPDPDPLAEQLETARPVWLAWRDGSGGLQRGGLIALAKVLFGPEATGAGHQYRIIQKIVTALEVDAPPGACDRASRRPGPGPKAQTLQRPLEGSGLGGIGLACGPSPGGALTASTGPTPALQRPDPRGSGTSQERPLEGTVLPTHWAPALLRRIPQKQGSGRGSKKNVQR